jgi:signal transduction histidine kinase
VPEPLPRVFRARTIRVQLTLAITAVVALVVALAGLAVVLYADHRDRDSVDATLTTRAAQVRTAAAQSGSLPADGTFAVRLLDGTEVRATVGAKAQFSIPVKDGYSTVSASDKTHWRSWAETLKTGAQLQVLVPLQAVEDKHSRNVVMIDLIVVLAALVAAAGTWFVGGLILKPLVKLAQSAQASPPDHAEARLPEVTDPPEVTSPPEVTGPPQVAGSPEVADIGAALNEALDRMNLPDRDQLAAEAARAATVRAQEVTEHFAKESAEILRAPLADLGNNLDQLLDNPEMTVIQRHLVLAAIQTEYRRIVDLVDELEPRAHR